VPGSLARFVDRKEQLALTFAGVHLYEAESSLIQLFELAFTEFTSCRARVNVGRTGRELALRP
jgi:hypothetical protein